MMASSEVMPVTNGPNSGASELLSAADGRPWSPGLRRQRAEGAAGGLQAERPVLGGGR